MVEDELARLGVSRGEWYAIIDANSADSLSLEPSMIWPTMSG
jgi:hypothetical protein